ncbi:MAG: 16S rRNA (cytosine(1402)-N(4))-methyltransferase RsmH [Acidimicrobiia bacterium]|nr:16S rRNA (cytosine(1402)-N(4))-methyltransferase RsmH [bacterium]MXX00634.1 16S rRNA (cytosine(1402)-N(4))-methyltransferase RsmH [Acidimicrobiia bacterium]MDE0673495.1 16S rRNA (cytosine(1402)-N(4))-methyltransferase RsmH [bacterium]MXY73669.1 16S rRNA (cytosine(1402)-N(4))-methyltransferase RsmH [Acidimicrobiia bacterium]MYA40124.1 16S rRNA (cytosine(1402)-N(4))-methyltransferase RsmH [Acidimicrobiia bacterium]
MSHGSRHEPVMADLVCELFEPIQEGTLVDATFGGGGHSLRLQQVVAPHVRIMGIDRDPAVGERAAALGFDFIPGDFADIERLLSAAGVENLAGVLFDFGLSSDQLDDPERGFSYHRRGPLDMRMDPGSGLTADQVVNTWDCRSLARVIARYGEEPSSRRIARAIVANRPLADTLALAEVVAAAVPAALRRKGHPARRTFQAIRMAVNDELGAVRTGLEAALGRLEEGGRCVAISYHSLEDRLVKQRFKKGGADCVCPSDLPICGCGLTAELRPLVNGSARPEPAEVEINRRARSARLRAVERLAA